MILKKLAQATIVGTDCKFGSSGVFTFIEGGFWRIPLVQTTPRNVDIEIYEIIENCSFVTAFGSIDRDLDSLVLTLDEIHLFCRDHIGHLRQDGFGTFFLFKEKWGAYFVAHVHVYNEGIRILYEPLHAGFPLKAEHMHRLVVASV